MWPGLPKAHPKVDVFVFKKRIRCNVEVRLERRKCSTKLTLNASQGIEHKLDLLEHQFIFSPFPWH